MSSGPSTVLLTGDIMTGRGIDQILEHASDPVLYESWARSSARYVELAERQNGPIPRSVRGDYVWGDALEVLRQPGISARIINLETAITVHDTPWPGKGINYRMHPGNTATVLAGKVDCCVLANNHVLDWGRPGLVETVATLERSGLAMAGAGTEAEAAEPSRLMPSTGPATVVVAMGTTSSGIPISWAAQEEVPGVALAHDLGRAPVEGIAAHIESVVRPGDVVIASIHWGPNWGYAIPTEHRRFAHALIAECGVDIVHGHSSHHPLGIEVYRNKPVLYGCGDLINDYEGIPGYEQYRPNLGLVYLVTFDSAASLHRFQLVPFLRRRFRLEQAGAEDRSWLAGRLDDEGQRFGTRVMDEGEMGLRVHW